MIRKNVSGQYLYAQMNSATDGLPLTASVSFNYDGGTYGAGAGTVSHRGGGLWRYALTQGETNVNSFGYQFSHATGVAVGGTVLTTAADPTNATSFGIGNLDAAVSGTATQASVNTLDDYVDTEVAAILAAVDTEVAAIKLVTDKLNTALEADGASGYQYTTLALENAPTGSGGGGGLDAAGIRAAVGLAAPNLDTQLGTLDDYLDTELMAVKAKTDLIPASPAAVGSAMTLSSAGLDAIVVESGVNARQALAVIASAVGGVLAGAATAEITTKAVGNPGTTRLTGTVDSEGNRSAITLNLPT